MDIFASMLLSSRLPVCFFCTFYCPMLLIALLNLNSSVTVTAYEAQTWLGGCHTKVRHGCPHVGAASELFFFFFSRIHAESGSIRTDSARIGFNSHRFGQNRVVSTSNLNRPKQAEISLELCWNSRNRLLMRPKHPKFVLPQFYSEYLSLLLCFLFNFVFLAFFFLCFVNQGIVMCFLRIF